MPIPGRSPEDATAERDAFARYLRTGRRAAPLEVKFNPNHDQETGRFTFADGGGGPREGEGGGGGRSYSTKPAGGGRAGVPDGPFRSAARRQDRIGALAREANAFVQRRADRLVVPLNGIAGNLTITRGKGDKVYIDNLYSPPKAV